jgi:hypothetical protein
LRATYVAAASSHRSVDRVGNAAIEHSTRVLVAPWGVLPQLAFASTRLPAHSCGITEIFIAVGFAVRPTSFAMKDMDRPPPIVPAAAAWAREGLQNWRDDREAGPRWRNHDDPN